MKKILFFAVVSFMIRLSAFAQTGNLGLNFDGVDDRVTVNDNAAYNIGTGNFTIEAWIKANSSQFVSFPTILSKRETGNVNSGLLFFLISNKLTLQMDGINLPSAGTTVLNDNVCHHVAVTRTGTNIAYYIDGALISTLTGYGQDITASHAFWIGRDDPSSSTTPFRGLIHEVRFWNSARSQAQLQGTMNAFLAGNESGLVGYWRMNDATGQNVNDFTSLNNDGFLGTINTADGADPLYINGCYCSLTASITAGGPTTFCSGGSVLLTANTGAGYTYQWKKNAVNIGGATAQTYSATTTGSYTCLITNTAGCSATSNAIAVTASTGPPATITAGGPLYFCTGGSVTLNANSGAGLTYQWRKDGVNIGGATSISYSATQSGAYTCLVTDNCGTSTSNSLTVTLYTSPPTASISAGGPTTFCSGGSVILTANSGVGFTYSWYKNGSVLNSFAISYTATLAGSYTCVVTNPCGSSTSNAVAVTVNANPPASITAGGPLYFCTGGSVVLTANSGAGYTYQWKLNGVNIGGATLQSYTATQAGNYTVSVTSNGCTGNSSAVTVTVQQALTPTITSGGFWGFCASTTTTIETQSGTGYLYQWFEDTHPIPNSNNYQIAGGHDGNYAVNITNSCGTYSSGLYPINDFGNWGIPPFNNILYTGSLAICSGGSVYMYNDGLNYYRQPSYQWYKDGVTIGGATGPAYTATTPGNYVLSVSDYLPWCGQGPTVFSNWLVATSGGGTAPTISISAGGATTWCGAGNVTLNSTVNTGVTYQWAKNNVAIGGATAASYAATFTGTYTCVVTNTCGTATSNGIVVTSQSLSVSISGNSSICTGSSSSLSVTNPQTGNAYQWKLNGSNIGGATSSSYSATAAGSYTCTITNLCGTTTSNALVLTVRPLPTATISGSQTICSGGNATLSIAFTGTGNWVGYYFDGANYTYYSTALNPYTFNVSPTTTKTYTLYTGYFHDAYCNGMVSGSATVTVTSSAVATITPAGSTTFCSGGSVTLNANTGTGYTYLWKKDGTSIGGATASSYSATATGSYTVQVTSTCGTATSSAVVVTVNALPNATITPAGPTTFCAGGSVTLNAVVAANRAYQWKKNGVDIAGATSSSYVANATGTYKVTVTNTSTGCSKTTTAGISVTKNALPTATITPQGPTTFCAGGSVVLAANTGAGLTYKWKKGANYIGGATSSAYTATLAGTYKVQVTNSNGCSKTSAGVVVTVPCRESGELITDDAFNVEVYPNPSSGDFIFEISNAQHENVSIKVFDIIGKLILTETIHNSHFTIYNLQLNAGVYTAVISSGTNIQTVKLVKTN